MAYDILPLLPHFRFEGAFETASEIGAGNINATYHITCRLPDGGKKEYLLQRINTYVFKDPVGVMRNIDLVTRHIERAYRAQGVDPARRVLRVIPTREGGLFHRTDTDDYWRAYNFVTGATAFDRIESPAAFREAARGFGEFQRLLTDFPAAGLAETIPGFHHTARRFETFEASVRADRAGRVKDLAEELAFLRERKDMMCEIVKALEAGRLPVRVTHNDTKINNVMIDDETGRAICVIDLDTVMPGSALYDFGDAIRSGAATVIEDDPDFDKVAVDLTLFEAFTDGFLSEVKGILTPEEIERLPLSAKVITCEQAMRFLTDYIDGDLYYKIRTPDHNLVRARNQMALVRDMERRFGEMQAIVKRYAAKV
ncbi:MAG: aminoglycoside phosphotransferase family protein [Clostridia bacterium]|nr:aminoglycoside phosphotransferase family protein [Clostridia bacterium]